MTGPLRFEGSGGEHVDALPPVDGDWTRLVAGSGDGSTAGFDGRDQGARSDGSAPAHRRQPLSGIELVILGVALVAGFVLRWNLVSGPLGYVDLDEATAGIAAREFLGQPSVFFPNQPYGGSIELALASLVHLVAGSSTWALKVTPILLHLAAAGFVLGAARRVVPSRAGQLVAPILFWCGPAFGVWESTKERGFYGAAVLLAAVLIWLAARIDVAPDRRDVIAFGLCLGVGWWTTPLIALVAVPVVVWLLVRDPERLALFRVVVPSALVGALPWLVWNAVHGMESLRQPPSFDTTILDRFGDGVLKLSVLSGLETPWDPDRVLVPGARVVAVLLVFTAVAVGLLRSSSTRSSLPAAVVLGYLLLYPLANSTGTVGPDPRYLYPVLPALALAVAGLIPRGGLAHGAVRATLAGGLIVAVSHWGTTGLEEVSDHDARFLNARGTDEVISFLQEREIDFVITDMAGTQITYASGGDIRAASFAVPRFVDLEREMLVERPSTYVVDDHLARNGERLVAWLDDNSIPYERLSMGVWTVVVVDRWVPPWEARLVTMQGLVQPPGDSIERGDGTDELVPDETDRSGATAPTP